MRLFKTILFFIGASLQCLTGLAQNKAWTLDKCIERAWDANLSVLMDKNSTQMELYNKRAATLGLLPTLNSSHNFNYNYGRTADENYEITFDPTYGTSHSINASVILFRGMSNVMFARANKYIYEASLSHEAYTRQQIALSVMQAWYYNLLQRDLVKVEEERLKTSEKQLEYVSALVEVGKLESTAVLYGKTSVSRANLALLKARNRQKQLQLNLMQLLELDHQVSFEITNDASQLCIPANLTWRSDSLFNVAQSILPGIQQLEFQLKAAEKQYSAQWGKLLPSLSANAGVGTSYFKAARNENAISYPKQLDNKLNYYAGLRLSIPIFNGMSQNYSMQKSKLNIEQSKLTLHQRKRDLYKEIETSLLELESAYLQYIAALENETYLKKSYATMQERFKLGLANVTDLMV